MTIVEYSDLHGKIYARRRDKLPRLREIVHPVAGIAARVVGMFAMNGFVRVFVRIGKERCNEQAASAEREMGVGVGAGPTSAPHDSGTN